MWDLSSPARGGTFIPCVARRILNHCTTREVMKKFLFDLLFQNDVYSVGLCYCKQYSPSFPKKEKEKEGMMFKCLERVRKHTIIVHY